MDTVPQLNLLVVGLNHRTAPLWIRERAAFASWAGAARDVAEQAALTEALVLSTCNRVEVYGAAAEEDVACATERVAALLAERTAMPIDVLRGYLFTRAGTAAAAHLARVAAGMDSMVLGETQIVAQLKRALGDARQDGVCGRVLERAVSLAFAAGKRARPLLGATCGAHSVAEAAVRALGGVGAIEGASVAVVGAGSTAADLLHAIAGARPRRLVMVNRTLRNALPLAARHGAAVASWEALGVVVADADVVFACTSSAAPVIVPAQFEHAPMRPRTLVDLGVPRNVAPELAGQPETRLIDVDSLGAWSPRPAQPIDAAAEAEVARWAERFDGWRRTQQVLPTIAQLRERAERVCEHEVERALNRLGTTDPRERAIVRELAARLASKLLHHPLSALSGAPDAGALAESACRLFALDVARGAAEHTEHPNTMESPFSALSAAPRAPAERVA